MNTIENTIGQNVRRLREAHGWTQEELGRAAGGINKDTINRLEGGASVKVDTVQRVAIALGVTLQELVAAPLAPPPSIHERIGILIERYRALSPKWQQHIDDQAEALLITSAHESNDVSQ